MVVLGQVGPNAPAAPGQQSAAGRGIASPSERLAVVAELVRSAASGLEQVRADLGPALSLDEAGYALHRALIALAEVDVPESHQPPVRSSPAQPGSGLGLAGSR